MIFSRACEIAIRATLYVAVHGSAKPVLVRDIAQALDVPVAYLAKIVQQLTRPGILTSIRGPGGGVSLARAPEDMTLIEVVDVIEGHKLKRECVLGIPGCSEDVVHCPFHEQWGDIRDRILAMLSDRTLAEVAGRLAEDTYILSGDIVAACKTLDPVKDDSESRYQSSVPKMFE